MSQEQDAPVMEQAPTDSDIARLQQLASIDPQNLAMHSMAARTPANAPFVSTEAVAAQGAPFDAATVQMAMQAKAGEAEYLNLSAPLVQGGIDQIMVAKAEFQKVSEQLNHVRIPNTRVNVRGKGEVELSHDIKLYANERDQASYVEIIHVLLGTDRMQRLLGYVTKANQMNTPALWLSQHLELEAKDNSVYMLAQNIDKIGGLLSLTEDLNRSTTDILRNILGNRLFMLIKTISDSQKISCYQVFVILVDRILGTHDATNKPVTSQSIWDRVVGDRSKNSSPVPTLTAEAAKRMGLGVGLT